MLFRSDVSFEAVAVIAVCHNDSLVGEESGCSKQFGIDGDASVIINVSLSDGRPVDFGL